MTGRTNLNDLTHGILDRLRDESGIEKCEHGFISDIEGWRYAFPGVIYNFKIIPHGKLVVWFGDVDEKKRKFQFVAWVKDAKEAQPIIDDYIKGHDPVLKTKATTEIAPITSPDIYNGAVIFCRVEKGGRVYITGEGRATLSFCKKTLKTSFPKWFGIPPPKFKYTNGEKELFMLWSGYEA